MLGIRPVKHLLKALDTTPEQMSKVLESPNAFYEDLLLTDPAKPDKPRTVVNVLGTMRAYQTRLYRRVLLPKLGPSIHSHGGVRGRSIKTNAGCHLGSGFVFKTDISNFYPSIHYRRVYRLFIDRFECSPDVARICTKICTYRNHLALGLICSPILADQIANTMDRRIAGACKTAGLTYSRYVDDITVSGSFDLEKSGFVRLVKRILEDEGFSVNVAKNCFGSFSDNCTITNLREIKGHLDVRAEYVRELVRQIDDAAALARDEEFDGPYYTPEQILGRVRFVCWVNPGRRRELVRRYRSVRWTIVREHARRRGYECSRPTLSKVST